MADVQPPLGGPSLDAEEKAMKGGKGGMIAGTIIVLLLLGGAGTWAVMSGGETDRYGEFGRTVNGIHSTDYVQFWACALQSGTAYDRMRTNEDLGAALDQRATRGGTRFGARVRDACMPKLADMKPKIDSLLPPEDLRTQIRELGVGVDELRSGWSEYIAYLDQHGSPYDHDDALDHVVKIEKGWFDYKHAFKNLNDHLRAKIQH
jgi:hypothetical protein